MKEKKCSACGDDLTHIVMTEDYRLTLTSTHLDIRTDDIVNENEYFCGLGCLKTWLNKELEPVKQPSYRELHANPDCEKCHGSGWVWNYELESYSPDPYDCSSDDTMYTCDLCFSYN